MERRTSNYAPENLPLNFDVVDTTGAVKKTTSKSNEKDRKESIRKIKRCVWFRKILYGLFLESTIAVAVFAWCFKDITLQKGDGLMDLIAKTLDSVLPDFVNGLITVAVIQHPSYFWGAVSVFAIYGILRKSFRLQTVETSEKLRAQVLKSLQ